MACELFRMSFTWCCFSVVLASIACVLQACTNNDEFSTSASFQGNAPTNVPTNSPTCSADVVLILDKSKSVGSNWGSLRNAAINFVSKLERKNEATNGASQIAVLSFARNAEWGTTLTDSFSWARTKIHEISRLYGCTRLYPALDEVALELIGSTKEENQKVAVVFSDGEPTCDRAAMDKAYDSARSFRNYGRLVIVGMRAQGGRRRRHGDDDFMKSLATAPADENYYELQSFGGLTDAFLDSVVEGICKKQIENPTPSPTPPFHNQTTLAPTDTPTFPLD